MTALDQALADRQLLIDTIQDAIDHILANSAAFNEGNAKSQARFVKLVIKHVHNDLQKGLNTVQGFTPDDSPSTYNPDLDDIPF